MRWHSGIAREWLTQPVSAEQVSDRLIISCDRSLMAQGDRRSQVREGEDHLKYVTVTIESELNPLVGREENSNNAIASSDSRF